MACLHATDNQLGEGALICNQRSLISSPYFLFAVFIALQAASTASFGFCTPSMTLVNMSPKGVQ